MRPGPRSFTCAATPRRSHTSPVLWLDAVRYAGDDAQLGVGPACSSRARLASTPMAQLGAGQQRSTEPGRPRRRPGLGSAPPTAALMRRVLESAGETSVSVQHGLLTDSRCSTTSARCDCGDVSGAPSRRPSARGRVEHRHMPGLGQNPIHSRALMPAFPADDSLSVLRGSGWSRLSPSQASCYPAAPGLSRRRSRPERRIIRARSRFHAVGAQLDLQNPGQVLRQQSMVT